jgi:hypothetical protein
VCDDANYCRNDGTENQVCAPKLPAGADCTGVDNAGVRFRQLSEQQHRLGQGPTPIRSPCSPSFAPPLTPPRA